MLEMNNIAILGIGTALPRYSITQEEAVQLTQTFDPAGKEDVRLLTALYRRTRVKERGSVLLEGQDGARQQSFFEFEMNGRGPTTGARMRRYMEEAPVLAMEASVKALENSKITPKDITHLITVSCTGFHAPGIDIELIKKLGLSPSTQRTHVGFMGCHGALNGLRIAKAFVDADSNARVLLCAVELCSLHFQYGADAEQAVANALFADGAAAIVVGAPKEGSAWRFAASGSSVFPDSTDVMTWEIGDHGFEMGLSARISGLIIQHLPAWCESWLKENKLKFSDIRSWAIHPGGPKILDSVAECLKLSPEMIQSSKEILVAFGNMSSPTILFVLQDLIQKNVSRPCVALGFGPGLSVEAALFV